MQDFLAGRLRTEDAALVEAHLSSCHACASLVQKYQTIERSLRRLPQEHASRGFTEKVLEQTGLSTPRLYRFADVMAGVMAAMFVGGVLLLIFGLLGIIPITSPTDGASAAATAWNSFRTRADEVVRAIPSSLGFGPVRASSVILTVVSIAVIAVLLGLDHIVERWTARGNGAR
jgi:anti-sigma factor RsiW